MLREFLFLARYQPKVLDLQFFDSIKKPRKRKFFSLTVNCVKNESCSFLKVKFQQMLHSQQVKCQEISPARLKLGILGIHSFKIAFILLGLSNKNRPIWVQGNPSVLRGFPSFGIRKS